MVRPAHLVLGPTAFAGAGEGAGRVALAPSGMAGQQPRDRAPAPDLVSRRGPLPRSAPSPAGQPASEDHELIRRAGTLCDAAERTDTEIIADWCRALDALFAHGVEDALPPGADPAPLDFAGIGNYPILKLLEQHGTATAEILSAEIGEGPPKG